MKHLFTKALLLCLPLLLFGACLNDALVDEVGEGYSEEYGKEVTVSVNLSVAQSSAASRAANEGVYVADVEPWELIHSYRVVFTDGGGKIVALYDKTLGTGASVEYDPIRLQLRAGSYKAYGFANIDFAYLNGLGITKGATMPDLSAVRFLIEDYGGGYFASDKLLPVETFQATGKYIPMTSVNGQSVTVTDRVNQTFGIEVRRLFAKIQFDYSYPYPTTAATLLLKAQSIKNLTIQDPDPAVLLMNYEGLRDTEDRTADIDLPAGFKFTEQKHTYATPVELAPKGDGDATVIATQSFYVLESRGDKDTKSFELSFTLADKADESNPDVVRLNITNPDYITRIHRNDWIRIPVTLGDWLMDLDVYCYPPIDGYPEATIDAPNQTEFHVTFKDSGKFALAVGFHKYYDPSSLFWLTDLSRVVSCTVSAPTGDAIFTPGKEPHYASGEITGYLKYPSPVYGTAYVDVTTEFIPNPLTPAVHKTIKRRIYMTRAH